MVYNSPRHRELNRRITGLYPGTLEAVMLHRPPRHLVFPFLILLVSAALGAPEAGPELVRLLPDESGTVPSWEILASKAGGLTVELRIPSVKKETIQVEGEDYQVLTIPGAALAGEPGQAALPVLTRLFALEKAAAVEVRVLGYETATLTGLRIMPQQPLGAEGLVQDEAWYARTPHEREPGVVSGGSAILGGLRVAPVVFSPVRYDPVTGEATVATRLHVEITTTGKAETTGAPDRPLTASFDRLLASTVLNYSGAKETVATGTYLMITPDNADVTSRVQDLLQWRRRQGYNVILATTAVTGSSTSSIKSYIQGIYDTTSPPLEFVCLVGDAAGTYVIPTWNESVSGYGGEGDHYYTTLAGGDVLSDVHIGRLSFRNLTELENIVRKIVDYETSPYAASDPAWFQRACVIGDPSVSGMSCVFVGQWLKDQLLDLNYTEIDTIWSGDFPTLMYEGLSTGGTVFAYRGYYGTSQFTTGYIDAATNGEKLPFAVVLTCDTGSFQDSHCRSEAFLRAPNGGGIGAIGMATIGTHTRYNNCLYNGIWEGALNMGDFRLGPAQTRGKLEMYSNYQVSQPTVVETWSVWNNLMGDPATMLWSSSPKDIEAEHPAAIAVGTPSVEIIARGSGGVPLADAVVSLYKAGEIRVVGTTDAFGAVVLPLDAHTAGSLLVTIQKHNWKPYRGSLTIGTVSTQLVHASHVVDDDASGSSNGNGDGLLNAGETIELAVQVANLGTDLAGGVAANLTTADPYVTLDVASQTFGDIPGGGDAWSVGSYVLTLAPDTPGGHLVELVLGANAGVTWSTLIELVVHGPAAGAEGYAFDGPGGDLDPGESGNLAVTIRNTGNEAATTAVASLTSHSPWISVTDATGTYGAIPVGGTGQNDADPFGIAVAGDCFQGHLGTLELLLDFADGARSTTEIQVVVGTKSNSDPVGPDAQGYYAFDDTDTGYDQAPAYAWIEIDPDLGGSGTSVGLTDTGEGLDDTGTVMLPFAFSFYGEEYDRISICSNGWLAFGTTYQKHYRNWTMPGAGGADNLVAVFWDDLELGAGSDVLTWHDTDNHCFVVEWNGMRNAYNGTTETFQALLYDPAYQAGDTGDGVIVCQYATVANVDGQNGYATVGLQNADHSDGLLYTYWNRYAAGGATLAAGRAIKFSTVAPQAQGYLEGDVTCLGSGQPVDGATVRILEAGRALTTQVNGHYLGTSPEGSFTVVAEHPSFAPDTAYAVAIVEETTTTLDFALVDAAGPAILADALGNTDDPVGPYVVQATIGDYSGVAAAHFYYTSSATGGPHELPLVLVDPATGLYEAQIPGQPLGTRVQYWLTAADTGGRETSEPAGAPWDVHGFLVVEIVDIFSDDMESDQGWTIGEGGDTATTGIWVRVDPNGVWEGSVEVQPEDDATPAPGSQCYITGNDPSGSAQGADDVDGGRTTLLSPVLDLSAHDVATVDYARWYTNDTGNSPGLDYWRVEVNDGLGWQTLENTNASARTWLARSFALQDVIDLSATVQLRFVAEDLTPGSVVEAGVDEFHVQAYTDVADGAPPAVTVTYPDGGEVLQGGGTFLYDVTWNAGDDIGVVQVEILLSVDGGASYPTVLAEGPLTSPWSWQPPGLEETDCRLKVIVHDAQMNTTEDASDADFSITSISGIGDMPGLGFALAQNHPNPFNPRTRIEYGLPRAQRVSLRIYDLQGRLVRTLVDARQEPGLHAVIWGGENDLGARVSSGLYFYRLRGDNGTLTRKMLLLK
jgi:hypothetical protein